ncbi:MAG: hypothetical protein JWN09_1461, partial [Microbacteriaceae bacterium]|nr:hypothetical protein [Microbacteriaceae bacterium]
MAEVFAAISDTTIDAAAIEDFVM